MSDHAWTQENVAAFVVGGLTAEETERFENHVRDCPDCAAAVAAARRVDRGLESLFADVRPDAGLEDRAIRSTRAARRRRIAFGGLLPRLAIAAGILLMLGIVGAMAGALVGDGRLPLPGDSNWFRAGRPSAPSQTEVATADRSDSMKRLDEHLSTLAQRATRGIQYRNVEPNAEAAGQSRADADGLKVGAGQVNQGWGYAYPQLPNGSGGAAGGSISGGIGGIPGNNMYTVPTTVNGSTLATGGLPNQPGSSVQFGGPPQATNILTVNPTTGATASFHPTEHQPAVPADPKEPVLAQESKPAESGQPAAPSVRDPEPAAHRVVIRSGDMEFEVNSFDAAAAVVTKLVTGLKSAFVATVNSDKLANGKVRGSITIRTPPEHLDRLVLDLRRDIGAAGELKGMKISSQDVTKQYTDLESRLRAARAMEQRLLQMIKDGKGEIKQLLDAERELGKWRTQIEEFEGEMRYYANLAALATLTITLTEKEIRAAAVVSESERVQAGIEVDDVDKAYQQTLAVVAELKGRVAKSELKQLAAGQFNASLQFEVPPDAAGPVRDRLRQLGRVARLEIDRAQHAVGGSPPADGKVKRGDTLFLVQLYNLANIAARETATLQVAVPDVRAAYQALRDAAGKAAARVLVAQINEQDARYITAQIDIEVRRADDGAFRAALDAAGEVVSRQVTRAPEGDGATDSKMRYQATLLGINRLSPLETTTMTLEVPDVEQAAALFAAQVAEVKGRQLSAESTRDPSGKVTAKLTYEVPLAAAGLVDRFKSAGTVRTHHSARDPQAPAGKYATARFDVTLVSGEQIVAEGNGLWPQIRRGLSYSMTILLMSVTWVVFGLCVVLPWGLVGYGGYRLVRRLSRRPLAVVPTTPG
jgi:hypothetical protein